MPKKKNKIKITKPSVFDIPEITQMWKALIDETKLQLIVDDEELERYAIAMTYALNSQEHVLVIAKNSDTVIGYSHAKLYATNYGKPRYRLFSESTYVKPEYRKIGIATKLTDEIIVQANKHAGGFKIGLTELQCIPSREMIERWKAIGFKVVSVKMVRDGNG